MEKPKANPENYYLYRRESKYRAREFRNNPSRGEKILWKILRRRNILGWCFLRQRSVLEFFADFMCKELLLIIECDGIFHQTDDRKEHDLERDKKLIDAGYTILRYKDWEIINRPEEIEEEIKGFVLKMMTEKGLISPTVNRKYR
jgi:very-short-patch-repair endonuclease